jgi:hypothetical protein
MNLLYHFGDASTTANTAAVKNQMPPDQKNGTAPKRCRLSIF